MTKQMLSFTQKLKIHDQLKRVLHKDGDVWKYAPGVSDTTIGEMFSVNKGTVMRLRQEAFGEVRPVSNGASLKEIRDRLTAIEEYLTSKNPNWRD